MLDLVARNAQQEYQNDQNEGYRERYDVHQSAVREFILGFLGEDLFIRQLILFPDDQILVLRCIQELLVDITDLLLNDCLVIFNFYYGLNRLVFAGELLLLAEIWAVGDLHVVNVTGVHPLFADLLHLVACGGDIRIAVGKVQGEVSRVVGRTNALSVDHVDVSSHPAELVHVEL